MLKTDAAKIAKLDTDMFYDESWKPIYFGGQKSTVKVTRLKKLVPAWVLVNVIHQVNWQQTRKE